MFRLLHEFYIWKMRWSQTKNKTNFVLEELKGLQIKSEVDYYKEWFLALIREEC